MGLDPQWQRHITEEIRSHNSILFEDQACGEQLEAFHPSVVSQAS